MSLFSNIPPFMMFLFIVTICVFIFIFYVSNRLRPIRRVELLRPRDMRGQRLKVIQETDLGLVCKPLHGVKHRFIKAGPGWTFYEGGRMVTKHFAIEGTAYTGVARGDDIVNVPVPIYLKEVWGDDNYKRMPSNLREKVENEVVGITVDIGRIDEKEWGLPTITADDINDEDDARMLNKIAESTQVTSTKKTFFNNVLWLGLGAMIMFMAVSKGWF